MSGTGPLEHAPSMWSAVDELVPLLQDMRQANALQMQVMAYQFDLDGAAAAGQPELAWFAREKMLVNGIELALRRRGLEPGRFPDAAEATIGLLALLAQVDPAAAETAARLLTTPAPIAAPADAQADAAAIAPAVEQVREFLTRTLRTPSAASRPAAVREWADGVRALRETASALGLAQADGWYLSEDEAGAEGDWYEELLRHVSQ